MRLSLMFAVFWFAGSALMAFVFESQFSAGIGFAVGLAWLGMWFLGF